MAYAEPKSCDEVGIIPSTMSITIRGNFDDTKGARVNFGFYDGKKFTNDASIEAQLPTQIEFDRIRVPVQIYSSIDISDTDLRYVRVMQVADPTKGISKTAIFQVRKSDE
jgi:hypothetical protein